MTYLPIETERIDKFDFDRLARAYAILGWKWAGGIPDAQKLKSTAQDLLADIQKRKFGSVSSGGLTVYENGVLEWNPRRLDRYEQAWEEARFT